MAKPTVPSALGDAEVNVESNALSDALTVISICNSQDWSELNCQLYSQLNSHWQSQWHGY